MIQRIQSIFLVLAIVSSVLLFAVPVFHWSSQSGGDEYTLGVLETTRVVKNVAERLVLNIPLILINSVIIVFCIFTLLGFQNRVRQAKSCHLLLLLQLVLICYLFYDWDQVSDIAGTGLEWHFSVGIVFLILPAVLFLAARHFILKDEALVRSSNRLR